MSVKFSQANPRVPFETPVTNLKDGLQIIVSGIVTPKPDRLHVNFQCGPSAYLPDIALHFKADFENRLIVMNSRRNGKWESEEIDRCFPLSEQNKFEISFIPRKYFFEIIIDGCYFYKFVFRMPLNCVKTLQIDGHLIISKTVILNPKPEYQKAFVFPVSEKLSDPGFCSDFSGSSSISNCYAGPPPPYSPPAYEIPVIYNPVIPFVYQIQDGLSPGKAIHISGRPFPNNPERFAVNLKSGALPYSLSDTAFHFNPRFKYGSDTNLVVANTFINGKWGSEEKPGYFPFTAGVDFYLIIKCNPDCFIVTVNGSFLMAYKHRFYPITSIKALEINEDVFIHSMSIHNE